MKLVQIEAKIMALLQEVQPGIGYYVSTGTTRGDKVIRGRAIHVKVPANKPIRRDTRDRVRDIFNVYYATIKKCTMSKGCHTYGSGSESDTRYREIILEY
jgi:hypothetical protein